MRVAYITDEILNEAYERNDLNWMLMMWERKGIAGTYPTPEMHTFAFNQYLRALDSNQSDMGRTVQKVKRCSTALV